MQFRAFFAIIAYYAKLTACTCTQSQYIDKEMILLLSEAYRTSTTEAIWTLTSRHRPSELTCRATPGAQSAIVTIRCCVCECEWVHAGNACLICSSLYSSLVCIKVHYFCTNCVSPCRIRPVRWVSVTWLACSISWWGVWVWPWLWLWWSSAINHTRRPNASNLPKMPRTTNQLLHPQHRVSPHTERAITSTGQRASKYNGSFSVCFECLLVISFLKIKGINDGRSASDEIRVLR